MLRGHSIYQLNGVWCYRDDDTPVDPEWRGRPCAHCGKQATEKGHDACIPDLPGVEYACCGHGDVRRAYVKCLDGTLLYEYPALRYMSTLMGHTVT